MEKCPFCKNKTFVITKRGGKNACGTCQSCGESGCIVSISFQSHPQNEE